MHTIYNTCDNHVIPPDHIRHEVHLFLTDYFGSSGEEFRKHILYAVGLSNVKKCHS